MERINGDFVGLDHNHQQSPLILSNPNNNNIIIISNSNNINDNNNNNNIWDYSWMKINSRFKLWFIICICALLSLCCFLLIKLYGTIFMHKEVIPAIHWLITTFRPPVLAAILLAAISLFPVLLLPTVPFKWVAGMTFGYGLGFLLILVGEGVAVSLPYFIANRLFIHRIKKWLDNHRREAAFIRLAGDGDWFHQFRAVALIRLAPFPYVLFNYIAVVTGVKYSPYLAGSLLGLVPEIFVAIYSGILIRTVAEAMEDDTPVSKHQILVDGIGFALTLIATIVIGFYSKSRLKRLQEDGEQPWQQL